MRLFLPAALLLAPLVFAPAHSAAAREPPQGLTIACGIGQQHWSATQPPVNLSHIFCGELNRRDKAVGLHARPGGALPATAQDFTLVKAPDADGVYEARFRIGEGRRWREKQRSSFFPDHCEPADILASILFAEAQSPTRPKFRGASGPEPRQDGYCYGLTGRPLTLEGWLLPDGPKRINTAWPVRGE